MYTAFKVVRETKILMLILLVGGGGAGGGCEKKTFWGDGGHAKKGRN